MLEKVKKSLKFWLVIGLAAMFSFTCLSACGKTEKKEPAKQVTEQKAADQKPAAEQPKKEEGIPLPKDF